MNFFSESEKAGTLRLQLQSFMTEHVYPNERQVAQEAAAQRWDSPEGWSTCPTVARLKAVARQQGLWNLFLPHSPRAPEGLSNFEYAPLCEIMGRVHWASEVFNCSAPDTGNMETLERYASEALKDRWLEPLLRGEIRREGHHYVINGRKWWSTGAGSRHCKVLIVMGKTDPDAPRHQQQSMIVVPADTPGVRMLRPVPVFGYNHAPHGHMEVLLDNVRVPADHLLLGEGRGFEIAQGRLGPGRIHHCMRSVGVAERALELMCRRLADRTAFGRPLAEQGVWHERIAESRCLIEQARLLTMKAAWMMDAVGNKAARSEIAMIKVVAPSMACKVIDWAIQAHGGGGVSDDFPLAGQWAGNRTLRLADGPDEVHRNAIAKLELAKHMTVPGEEVELPITRS